MLKLKTCKSIKKRYNKTNSGFYIRKHAFKGHLLINKTKKQKRKLSQKANVSKSDILTLKLMLPYIKKW